MMQVRLAGSVAEMKSAYRLLHDAYVDCGYQDADPSGMRLLPQYLLPTSRTFVVLEGTQVTGTATLVAQGALGLPLESDFHQEYRSLSPSADRPVEVSGLVLRTWDPLAKFTLFRALHACSIVELQATDLLITVRAAHERFYSRSLLFERASGIRPCSQVKRTPGVLMRLDLGSAQQRFRLAHPSGMLARHFASDARPEVRPEESIDARKARRELAGEMLAGEFRSRWPAESLDVIRRAAFMENPLLEEALR